MKLSCFTRFAIKTYPNHTEDKRPKEHTLGHCFVIRDESFREGNFHLLIKT